MTLVWSPVFFFENQNYQYYFVSNFCQVTYFLLHINHFRREPSMKEGDNFVNNVYVVRSDSDELESE